MACHTSCNKVFDNNLKTNFKDQLSFLKDSKILKNKISNLELIGIEELRDKCNFDCGNSTVILVMNIFNNCPFEEIPFSTSSLLDSILHIYFISKQTDNNKLIY